MARYFEKVSLKQFEIDFTGFDCNYNDIELPQRMTKHSAAYDFFLPFDLEIKSGDVVKIPTGIKACFNEDEFLGIYIRSGIGAKKNIRLCNQVGIIDCDYYNNSGNEGDIILFLQNHSLNDYYFNKGDRLAQGIFQKYLVTDDDKTLDNTRDGGLGSTNKESEDNE